MSWRSADWPAVQDLVHYTFSITEEHTNEDTKPKANSAERRVGRTYCLAIDKDNDFRIFSNITLSTSLK
jgi:hypothetical protein